MDTVIMPDTFVETKIPPLLPTLDASNRVMYRTIKNNNLGDNMACLTKQAPAIIGANQRLAAYLPTAIHHPYHFTPLYTVCLRDAIRDAFVSDQTGKGDITRYFATLLERASLVLRYNLADDRGAWDPLYGEPLVTWIKAGGLEFTAHQNQAVLSNLSLSSFISGMYYRLVPNNAIPQIQHLRQG